MRIFKTTLPCWIRPAAMALLLALAGRGLAQVTFIDDFERANGPADGWTAALGTWGIAGGRLSTTAAGATESWIWAGTPPLEAIGDAELIARVEFGPRPAGDVGRHGGFMFFAGSPTHRGTSSGYTLDWIDRVVAPYNDYGFRLIRIDSTPAGVVHTPLFVGTPAILEVPLEWVIQVEGNLIRLVADGNLVFEVTDGTYRKGHLGVWAYNNGTNINVDNIQYTYSPVELEVCFVASALTGTTPIAIDFDASCTMSLNGVDEYDWDFGDGEGAKGQKVSHTFQFGGSYMVGLFVLDTKRNTGTLSKTLTLFDAATSFFDDFSRGDGPVDNWTVFRGQWTIFSEELNMTTAGQENWAWAGNPAFSFPANFTLQYTYRFLSTPVDSVGRHGGVMFCATKPTWRYDTTIQGYTVDWIDSGSNHSIRLLRVDTGAAQTVLGVAARGLLDPPQEWQIVVEGEFIRVFGDGVLHLEAKDSRYRKGFFGAWAYSNSQSIALDNVDVSSPSVSPCFQVSPSTTVPVGTEMTFDANCSSATGTPIASYEWDFGDGSTGTGALVKHSYPTEGFRTVKLTIRTEGGLSGVTDRTIEAFIPLESFQDDFAGDDGPPAGWTVVQGNWSIRSGALHNETPVQPESWIFAGDPPVRLGGITSIEFDLTFLNPRPVDPNAVGRHAGVIFFAQNTGPRFEGLNSGYTVDWIDRAWDHGYRISAFDRGVQRALAAPVADLEPGKRWRIEIDGDTIRFLVDGALKAEVIDGTYRVGFFGAWAYWGDPLTSYVMQVDFDNLKIGTGTPPQGPQFLRADADANGSVEITDAIYTLSWLFLGADDPKCRDSVDTDNNGALEITDVLYLLRWLYLAGEDPEPPGPDRCGSDQDPAGEEDLLEPCAFPPDMCPP